MLKRKPTLAAMMIRRHLLAATITLVLLTISAVGMSRNSFREIVTSAFVRQGALTSNAADSGIEWSIYWIATNNAGGATGTALNLVNLQKTLLQNPSLAGVAKDINDTTGATNYSLTAGGTINADTTLPVPTGGSAGSQGGYSLGLTNMGKLPITGMSQGTGSGTYSPAAGGVMKQAPDLWVIRADSKVPQGSVTFTHAKEAWFSTPVQ